VIANRIQRDASAAAADLVSASFEFDPPAGQQQHLTLSFSQGVSGLTKSDISIEFQGTDWPVPVDFDFAFNDTSGVDTATLTFPYSNHAYGPILQDGNYQLRIGPDAFAIGGLSYAQAFTYEFFFVNADATRDRVVNARDMYVLAQNWQQPGSFSQGDFNYDGMVDQTDLDILGLQWQLSIETPFVFNAWADTSNAIKLSWDDEVTGESHWEVWRSTDGVNFGASPLATVAGDGAADKAYIDASLSPQTAYWYRVRAVVSGVPKTFSAKKWAVTQPAIDLDVFEDSNQDLVHDNTYTAEVLEATQPTELPYNEDEDGDYTQLALIVNDAVPGATVTFTYSEHVQLFMDLWGEFPIDSGAVMNLADLGIFGSDVIPVFAKAKTDQLSTAGITATLSNGLTGSTYGLAGGTKRITFPTDQHRSGPGGRDDYAYYHDNVPDNYGGLDDGDGPQGDVLTDRDGFWDIWQGRTDTLIIGFAGHTQSMGWRGYLGQIWQVRPERPGHPVGVRTIANRIRNDPRFANWAITLFPEDPGNGTFTNRERCSDGVLGAVNPFRGNARINADTPGQTTGALDFLIDAILRRGIRRVGLFGYSHGAGSIRTLIEALAYRAGQDTPAGLRDRLTGLDLRPPVNFFWTAYVDGINVDFSTSAWDAYGQRLAEEQFPFTTIPGVFLTFGTVHHYNAYQDWTLWPWRDRVPLGGARLNRDVWELIWGRDGANFWEDHAESDDPRWPHGTDHTNRAGRGIAEDETVRARLFNSLEHAWQTTYPNP